MKVKENIIFVWIKEPGKKARQEIIENSLEELQRIVGGYIEVINLFTGLCIICNEDGRAIGLPDNVSIAGFNFVGTIIFVGEKGAEFADCKITEQKMRLLFPQMLVGD